jgi:hypothetical protein
LVLSSLFFDRPFFTVALHEPVRFANGCSLRRLRSAAELNVGIRPASEGVTDRYEGLWGSPLKPTTSATGQEQPCVPLERQSASTSKADIPAAEREVSFEPKADRAQMTASLN